MSTHVNPLSHLHQSSQSQQVNLPSTYSFNMLLSSSPNAHMSSSVQSARSSCISVQLKNAPRQGRETFTLSSAKSFHISHEDEEIMGESSDQYSEPPLSVHDGSQISQQDSQEFPLRNFLIQLQPSRISPLGNSNLDPSPLTDSSALVMEREYDRDTWRMYERIQSARSISSSRSGGGTLPDSQERGHCLSTIQSDGDDSSCSSLSEHHFAVIGADNNENDTMFELEL